MSRGELSKTFSCTGGHTARNRVQGGYFQETYIHSRGVRRCFWMGGLTMWVLFNYNLRPLVCANGPTVHLSFILHAFASLTSMFLYCEAYYYYYYSTLQSAVSCIYSHSRYTYTLPGMCKVSAEYNGCCNRYIVETRWVNSLPNAMVTDDVLLNM